MPRSEHAGRPGHFAQSPYQVRFEWGAAGLARLEAADVTIVVDVLRFSTTTTTALAADPAPVCAEETSSINGAPLARAAARGGAVVLLGGIVNAGAVADAVLAEQSERGARTSVAVMAAGELTGRAPGAALRFAVEDLLGAGAVIEALAERGIDHTSPEAAAAGEAFRALAGSLRHVVAASGSGRECIARGRAEEVAQAAALDSHALVPVLRGDSYMRR